MARARESRWRGRSTSRIAVGVALCISSQPIAGAFEVKVALSGAWPEVSGDALALELLRRIDASEAASLLLESPVDLRERVRQRLAAVPSEALDILEEARFLSPVVEASRAQCRRDRLRYLPTCEGPFLLRRAGEETTATCVRNGLVQTSAGEALIHAKDFVVRERFGHQAVEVVLCAPLAEAARLAPDDADRIAYRYDDGGAGTTSASETSPLPGHVAELRIKRSEYSTVVEEVSTEVDEEDDAAEAQPVALALERSSTMVELSESQLSNLPLQVSRLLLRSGSPLSTWREVAENLPAFLKSLAASKRPPKRTSSELSMLRTQTLAINGRALADGYREAPFLYIMEKVLEEVVALERRARGAASAQTPAKAEGAAQKAATEGGKLPRLDWRQAGLTWHYHVKKDEEAEEWPSRITALVKEDRDDMMGGFSNAARRIAEVQVRLPLVAVLVAFRPDDLRMLEVVGKLFESSLAGKVSLLPFEHEALPPPEWDASTFGTAAPSPLQEPSSGSSSARRLLGGAVVHAARQGQAPTFIGWLLKQHFPVSNDTLKEGFVKHGDANKKKALAAWKSLTSGSAAQPRSSADVVKLGVPVPSVVVNGRLAFSGGGGGAHAVLEEVRAAIVEEQRRFVDAVRSGSLKKADEGAVEAFALGGAALPPPLVALERRPQPRLPAEAVGGLPTATGRGGGDRDISVTVLLRSAENVAWLYPIAAWLRRSAAAYSLSVALGSDVPHRGCIAKQLRSGDLDAVARLAFGVMHGAPEESPCGGADTKGASSGSWLATPEAKVAMAASPLPSSGAALHCGGQLLDLPLLVPRHAVVALERLACTAPTAQEGPAWDAQLANLSAITSIRARREPAASSWLQVRGVVDPLAEEAPRVAAALEVLASRLGAEVALQLTADTRLSRTPLQKFSRSALPQVAVTDASRGSAAPASVAHFADLETEDILTAELVVPDCWCVTSLRSNGHDLDNLRRGDALKTDGVVDVEYLLQGVYVEGAALHEGKPVSGLQLELLDGEAALGESMVMQNFGYFAVEGRFGGVALRAKPGASNETFALVGPGAAPENSAASRSIVLDSFLLQRTSVDFQLRPKRKAKDLFDKTIGLGQGSRARRKRGSFSASLAGSCPTIHVFSVASGHLYEKLLRVMMTSVRKTTRCPVRFWFFDRFMSPDFKSSMAHFASSLNVTFEFVAFKWPSWLRDDVGGQFGIRGDKQRLIWAHKILFLDVIFPMDLQRVIFVDADIVVRGDLLDLYTMDLEGAPYAFTPFCSGDRANPETTGYRFWETGFWKSHLEGLGDLPYHISALFVVDLVEFRRLAVGDTLRSIYHGMAGDPNSLSNLDQDLPNYAQRTVPIKSLPEEWLWCESWCSTGAKSEAKAIDLCQNPKTKEPKISMARRVVEEWAEMDAKATELVAQGAAAPPSRAEL